MKRILIVEDNEKLRKEISKFLTNNGFETIELEDFTHAINEIDMIKKDMILLDLTLPNIDGLHICSEIRKRSEVPIVIVTSKNTEIDEILSMNVGADDFITKPFNTQILLARINNIFKRIEKKNLNKIEFYEYILDISKGVLINNNNEIELTKNEIKILYILIENKGRIVTREEIMTYLWDSEMFVDDNTLTVNINRLRTKLLENNIDDIIETKRGQGYIVK